MKKNILIGTLFIIAILGVFNKGFAQQQNQAPKDQTSEDSAAFNALVMYPDTIRLDIFEVCEYPAAIVNIASLQKRSSSDFTDAISKYSKDEQEDFWNLDRYPGLVTDLVRGGEKSNEEIEKILSNYPKEIHDDALKYGRDYYETLKKIDDLQAQTNSQFAQILSEYPQVTQDALKELTQFPEIISLLNDHLNLAVRIGDRYKRDPQRVIHRMDSLNLVQTRQNAEDAAAWKQNLEQNPEEANDLKSAASDYANENGYTQEEINMAPSPDYISNYYCNPYSYWFGYPGWYPYSYWYPYPFWFDCGFYYDAYGHMVFIGYPSYYFTNWYFYYPEHLHHYPHLGSTYIHHYYGHHGHNDGNSYIVHRWVKDNNKYLPDDFLTNDSKRTDAIKQIGQLNEDVQKKQNGKTVTTTARDQYFQEHTSAYPALKFNPQTKTGVEDKQQNERGVQQQPMKQPPARINTLYEKPAVNPKQTTTSPYNFEKINKAQEYHKEVWEQTQPTVQPHNQSVPQQQQQQQPKQQQQQQPQPQQQQKQQPQQQQKQQPQQPVRETPGKQQPANQTPQGKRK